MRLCMNRSRVRGILLDARFLAETIYLDEGMVVNIPGSQLTQELPQCKSRVEKSDD
jgi:hypothetical protein